MSILSFRVDGIPAPQGSKRYLGNGRLVESSKRLAPWRTDVRQAAHLALKERHADLWDGPVTVDLGFYMPRPKGHYRTGRNADLLRDTAPSVHATKPDVDKLIRAVLDALTGVVWLDDSSVVQLTACKGYAPNGHACALVDVQAVTP